MQKTFTLLHKVCRNFIGLMWILYIITLLHKQIKNSYVYPNDVYS